MARMHSRAKGKSGSKKPIKKIPSWSQYKGNDVEKLIVKYAKAGKSMSEIGMFLRDNYGINSVKALTGKTISEIVKEKGLEKELPEDLVNLLRKMVAVKQHLEKYKQDEAAKRGLQLTNSKILRMVRYYQSSGRLPRDWKLDLSKLKMYTG